MTVLEQNRGPDNGWPAGSLLEMLSPDSRAALLGLGVARTVGDGEILIRELDGSTHVILLSRAIVKITASLENGRTALLGIKLSGDVVGEMAALSGDPRCATVTVCGSGQIRVISKEEFRRYLERHTDAHLALTRMIMHRLRWADQRRVDFNGYSVLIRLARVLDELARTYGRAGEKGLALEVSLTQRELGALVGAQEGTAREELGKLKEQGVIQIGYRRLTVLDQKLLNKIAYEQE
ncbi:Crp/Fnr family transcriptional regulator [Spirillospora sp. CA-294931]|uniref:Crp/Fnr family transcriptional regulator n=1 Tax=Spirillospora sp. CA-294931 TaxID=3240042 RepID=UPI003D90E08C